LTKDSTHLFGAVNNAQKIAKFPLDLSAETYIDIAVELQDLDHNGGFLYAIEDDGSHVYKYNTAGALQATWDGPS